MRKNAARHIDQWNLLLHALLVLWGAAIVVKLIYVQFIDGNHYRQLAQRYIRTVKIKAGRGNIFTHDDKLLAVSVTKYDIYFDAVAPPDKIFYGEIDALARSLARYTSKPASEWKRKLTEARKKGRRYVAIAKGLTLQDYEKFKKFPVFKHGQFKGGFITEIRTMREYPFGGMLRRTIGVASNGRKYGLEGAYDKILTGTDGERLMQKIGGGTWKPVNNFNEKEPVPGKDLVSTIDMRFQDIAYHALLTQLMNYRADHGTVVIMETATGKIRAMVNLGRTSGGHYFEKINYAVAERYEPGSIFKAFTFLTLLEDGYIKPGDKIHLESSRWKYLDRIISDAHTFHNIDYTMEEAFAHSSNIATVQLTDKYYARHPKKYVQGLEQLGIDKKTGIRLTGEAEPVFPHPGDKTWKGYKLGMMSFGYGVELTPLQILTAYNSIANGGKRLRPLLAESVKEGLKTVETFKPEVTDASVADPENLAIIRRFMRKVVTGGTARNVNSPYVEIAGKTGTTQTEYWTGNTQYIASFAGFFPYEKPLYSMIVVIHKPDKSIGYYGNTVAGTVFREIAEQIMGFTPDTIQIALNEK